MKRRPSRRGPRLFVILAVALGLGWQSPAIPMAPAIPMTPARAAAPGIDAADICRSGGAPADAPMPAMDHQHCLFCPTSHAARPAQDVPAMARPAWIAVVSPPAPRPIAASVPPRPAYASRAPPRFG